MKIETISTGSISKIGFDSQKWNAENQEEAGASVDVAIIAGTITGARMNHKGRNPSWEFHGEFMLKNLQTGDGVSCPKLFLPGAAEGLAIAAFKGQGNETCEGGRTDNDPDEPLPETVAPVEIAIKVRFIASKGTGEYRFVSLLESKAETVAERLLRQAEEAEQKLLSEGNE